MIPTPKEYCAKYIESVYDKPTELSKTQLIEISSAFHAGIEAACKFIEEHLTEDGETNDEELAMRLVKFRRINKARALHINVVFRDPKHDETLN